LISRYINSLFTIYKHNILQELIERTGIVEKFLLIISHYKNNSDIIFELPFVFDVFCFILKVLNIIIYYTNYNYIN